MANDAVQIAESSTSGKSSVLRFPYASEQPRLDDYSYHRKLFKGHHFDAFRIKIDNPQYNQDYEKMRYIVVNFPGLISKVCADMLFIEPPKIKVKDGDQKFMDALLSENKMRIQNYQSGLSNSYYGDALFKVRVGKRNHNDLNKTVIIERVPPRIYFPTMDQSNMMGNPKEQELAWVIMISDEPYLRKEIHMPGKIKNQLFKLRGKQETGWEIEGAAPLSLIGLAEDRAEYDTGIDRSLLIHIPNFLDGDTWSGTSDYYDLDTLFFAINNRISKIDNILDKHSDPILMVPPGVIDEEGRVKKKALGVIQVDEAEGGKPEYIIWDASLENAYKQVEFFVDTTLMISETAPAFVGRDKGGNAESGRALKWKALRSLAKAQRKQLFYREGLIEVLYVAQLMAQEHRLKVDDIGLTGKPVKPEIEWSDGLPADMIEMVDVETKRVDAGLSSKKDAIMRLDDVDEDTAEQKVKDINKETEIAMPTVSTGKDAAAFGKSKVPVIK